MSQIFRPSANTLVRISLMGAAALPVILGYGLGAFSRSGYNTKIGVPINQPIPFSHQHHAYELGIDCRYCHTTVEKSAFAGLPQTETCMSCHSQIWTNSPLLEPLRQSYETNTPIKWNRVNKVPDFVFFNHSIHISRGINCNQCHGAMEDEPITAKGRTFEMQWCLQCHRAPEKYLYRDPASPSPRQQVFDLYWKAQARKELTPRERDLLMGEEQYSAAPEDVAEGKRLIKQLHVKKEELADCWICHR